MSKTVRKRDKQTVRKVDNKQNCKKLRQRANCEKARL